MPNPYIPELDDLSEVETETRYRRIDALIDWVKGDFVTWLKSIRSVCQEERTDIYNIQHTANGDVVPNGAIEDVVESLHQSANTMIASIVESPPAAPPIPMEE